MTAAAARCRLCGRPLGGTPRLQIAPAPSGAQHFGRAADEARARAIVLEVAECPACGLVQSVTEPVAGFRRAITAAGVSDPMRAHRLAQAARLRDALGGGGRIALIGCGNGYELPILAEAGFAPEGMESGGAPQGYAGQWPVHDGYPGDGDSLPGAPYDAFACYNFLEHAPAPVTFLQAIARSLRAGGAGVVEVPNYAWQRAQGRTFDYVADHLSYFDTDTLRTALALGGFRVGAVNVVRGGENIEAYVHRRDAVPLAAEGATVTAARAALAAYLTAARGRGVRAAVWGASHQALTLLAGLDTALVTGIIDSSTAKQGLFAPGSGLPIVAPELAGVDALGVVVIIASGYEAEIRERLAALGFRGRAAVVRSTRVVELD